MLVVAGFALVGCVPSATSTATRDESGGLTGSGSVGALELQEGDCLIVGEAPGGDTEDGASDVGAVPCADEHTGEVIKVDDDFYVGRGEFPGEQAAFEEGQEPCVDAIEEYTQTSFDSSSYDVITLVPTGESWAESDDRGLACIGLTLNEDLTEIVTTTGSMRAR